MNTVALAALLGVPTESLFTTPDPSGERQPHRPAPATTPTQQAPAVLSPAARLIVELVAARLPGAPPSVISDKPLVFAPPLPGIPSQAVELATALEGTLEASGLFYESHLAEWVDGERSKETLAREPQSRLPVVVTPEGEEPQLSPPARALVERQLQALETREMVWQGQVWAGQPAEVRVGEQLRDANAPAAERAFRAVLKLAMPGLGEVTATVEMAGAALRIRLAPSEAATARRLADRGDDLHRALRGHDLSLQTLEVRRGAP